jgi:molybdopterin molybdotransferase
LIGDVRMRGFQHRTEVEEVLALIDGRIGSLAPEVVDVRQAAGRMLAREVLSPVPVPAFDRSAMDGYALRGSETFGADGYNRLELHIVGDAYPGRAYAGQVEPGQAVRIMTGAPIPAGADAVLQAEAAQASGASIVSSTTRADGLVLVPRDSEGQAVGEWWKFIFTIHEARAVPERHRPR